MSLWSLDGVTPVLAEDAWIAPGARLIGKVTRVEANSPYVEVEIAPNTKVRVVRSTLAAVGGATPAND